MQSSNSAVYFPQEKLTARFWVATEKDCAELLEALQEPNTAFVNYNGTVAPYKKYKGRLLFTFSGRELAKFHKVLAVAHKKAALTELLVNDEWLNIKPQVQVTK